MTTITQTITALPTAPNPNTQTPAQFNTNAIAHVAALSTMVTEQNTMASQMNTVSGEVNTNASTASLSSTSASGSAATTAAIANYAGAWSSLSGAKTVPLSVDHEGAFWILLENVADATAEEPGSSPKWARAYGDGEIYARASNVLLTAVDIGKIIDVTSGTFTQTFDTCANLGDTWSITYRNSGTGTITLDPDGAELIDGASTKTLTSGQIAYISCNGTALSTIVSAAPVGDHYVTVNTGNGHGSTNTKIRRFTTTQGSAGTDITYADSSTLGASFTINKAGLYSIYYLDYTTTGSGFGISLNSSELTTNIESIATADRLAYCLIGTTNAVPINVVKRLAAGDVIRPHTAGSHNGSTAALGVFEVRKVGI